MQCSRQLHLEREDDLVGQVGERSFKGKLLEQTSNVLMHADSWIFL